MLKTLLNSFKRKEPKYKINREILQDNIFVFYGKMSSKNVFSFKCEHCNLGCFFVFSSCLSFFVNALY